MAKNNDSFDFDIPKSKEKKEKTIKEKKERVEKDTSFDMDKGSGSFNVDKFGKKERKEKPIKEKEIKDSSFDMDGSSTRKPLFNLGKQEGELDVENVGVDKKKNFMILGIAGAALLVLIALAIVITSVIIPALDNHGMEIKSIEITRAPEKTVYMIGEDADYTGLRVTVTRNNGETFIVRADQCEFYGFDSKYSSETLYVGVSYGGCHDSFIVTIKGIETPDPILKSIRLDPPPTKTEYKVGEWLSADGGVVIREYMDGSYVRINLSPDDIYGWDKVWGQGPGEYELTVRYAENGVLATCTYTITVTE